MNERLTAVVGARISEFKKQMARVHSTMRKTATSVVVDVKARTEKAQNKLDRVARTIMTLQTIAASFAVGSLIAVSPSLIPVIAAAAGGLGALVTSFGLAGAAAVAFGGVAIPTIAKLFDENAKLTEQQKKAKGAFDTLKKTYQGIVKELEKPVLEVFRKSMEAANQIMVMAKPLFAGAAAAANNLMDSLKQSLGTPPVKAFFDYMNKQGGPMLEKVGKTLGNFLQGVMSMMVAFGPLSESFASGFLKMSESFAQWAAKLPESQKFQSFINYVRENGPKVLSLIGNLTTFLVNLGVAMAPVGTAILDITNKFFSWSSSMLEAHPIIGRVIGIGLSMLGVLKMFGPVLIATSGFFSGFGGTLAKLFPKLVPIFTQFKARIMSGLLMIGRQALAQGARMAAGLLLGIGPIGWIIAAVVGLVALIVWKWKEISSFTKKTWNAVATIMKEVWTNIKRAIAEKVVEVYSKVKEYFTKAVDFVKSINLYDSGKKIIKSAIDGILSMKNKVSGAVNKIAGMIRDFFPFSPAKEGPLSTLHRLDFAGPVTDSIARGKSAIQGAMRGMLTVPDFGMNPQLSADTSQSIIQDVSNDAGGSGSAKTVNNNFERMFEGANFAVRNEEDIDKLAKKLGSYIKSNNIKQGLVY
jgi:hypothetical protein